MTDTTTDTTSGTATDATRELVKAAGRAAKALCGAKAGIGDPVAASAAWHASIAVLAIRAGITVRDAEQVSFTASYDGTAAGLQELEAITRLAAATPDGQELTKDAAIAIAARHDYSARINAGPAVADVRICSRRPGRDPRGAWAHSTHVPLEDVPARIVRMVAEFAGDLRADQELTTGQALLVLDAVENPPPSPNA